MDPQTFSINAGDTLVIPVANTQEDGSALDLTSASGRFAMARKPGATVVVGTELSPPSASWAIDGVATNGNSKVTITSAVTETLLGTYYWEHVVVDATSQEVVTARGWLTVDPSTA